MRLLRLSSLLGLVVIALVFSVDAKKARKIDFQRMRARDGRLVAYADNLIPSGMLVKLTQIFHGGQFPLRYTFFDEYVEGRSPTAADLKNDFRFAMTLPAEEFETTRMWKGLKRMALEGLEMPATSELHLAEVSVHVLRRMDRTVAYNSSKAGLGDVNICLFLSPDWKKNHYGDALFYDDDRSVVGAVHPVFGRTVFFDASLAHLPHPPSMVREKLQIMYMFRAVGDEARALETRQHINEHLATVAEEQRAFTTFAGLPPISETPVLKVDALPWGHATNRRGQHVYYVDGAFSKTEVDLLRRYFVRHSQWNVNDRVSDSDVEADGVNVVSLYDIDSFVSTVVWGKMKQLIDHVTPASRKTWYPYDVATNLIQSVDDTRIHEDGNQDEDEWTLLMYLNPGWTSNDLGQTAFYEWPRRCKAKVNVALECKGQEDYELFCQVTPKFGRLALFQGRIPHAARPPSVGRAGPRYSFAVKLSVNKEVAKEKGPEGSPQRGMPEDDEEEESY